MVSEPQPPRAPSITISFEFVIDEAAVYIGLYKLAYLIGKVGLLGVGGGFINI